MCVCVYMYLPVILVSHGRYQVSWTLPGNWFVVCLLAGLFPGTGLLYVCMYSRVCLYVYVYMHIYVYI